MEMPDESGATATDIARREVEQRMNHLKDTLLALEPRRDDRPRGDVYADAMGEEDEAEHPGQRHDDSAPKKNATHRNGVSGRICRSEKWYDENPGQSDFPRFPHQDRLLFHSQIHHEFKYLHKQGFPALK